MVLERLRSRTVSVKSLVSGLSKLNTIGTKTVIVDCPTSSSSTSPNKQSSIDSIYERTTFCERGPTPVGLTQRIRATVIFWTADLRVTASTRIVLPLPGRGKSRPVDSTRAGRGAYAIRALRHLGLGIVSGRLGHLDP